MAAPWIALDRPLTWLIDLGGMLGLFAGAVFTPEDLEAAEQVVALRVGFVLAGLAAGSAAAWVLQRSFDTPGQSLGLLDRVQLQPWVEPERIGAQRAVRGGFRLLARF